MGKAVLKRVRLNKNNVLRYVDDTSGEIHSVPFGVEDDYWERNAKKYPGQARAHRRFKAKKGVYD